MAFVVEDDVLTCGGSDSEEGIYTSCELTQEVKDFIARLREAWSGLGLKPGLFGELLEKAGMPVPERTLQRWSQSLRDRGSKPSAGMKRGRPSLLDEPSARILCGFCLSKNETNEILIPHTVVEFAKTYLGVTMSEDTALNFLHGSDFSVRKAKRVTSGKIPKPAELAKIVSDWIREQRKAGLFPDERHLLGSIDFTYTRHTTSAPTTFAQIGS